MSLNEPPESGERDVPPFNREAGLKHAGSGERDELANDGAGERRNRRAAELKNAGIDERKKGDEPDPRH